MGCWQEHTLGMSDMSQHHQEAGQAHLFTRASWVPGMTRGEVGTPVCTHAVSGADTW